MKRVIRAMLLVAVLLFLGWHAMDIFFESGGFVNRVNSDTLEILDMDKAVKHIRYSIEGYTILSGMAMSLLWVSFDKRPARTEYMIGVFIVSVIAVMSTIELWCWHLSGRTLRNASEVQILFMFYEARAIPWVITLAILIIRGVHVIVAKAVAALRRRRSSMK